MKSLLLWLEGPLQSWGADSRFWNRTTLPFPTRSGVMGLLCCALGRGGEQEEWLAHMASVPQTVRAYAREKYGRVERQPFLRDFHMIGSGYDQDDPWQSLLVPKTGEGKKPVGAGANAGAKITYREYVQDMAFACVLQLPDGEVEELNAALEAPVWELSLGRRCCPPSERIGRGVFSSEEEAFGAAEELAAQKGRRLVLTVRDGSDEECDEVLILNDVPVRFGPRKAYQSRQVSLYLP